MPSTTHIGGGLLLVGEGGPCLEEAGEYFVGRSGNLGDTGGLNGDLVGESLTDVRLGVLFADVGIGGSGGSWKFLATDDGTFM